MEELNFQPKNQHKRLDSFLSENLPDESKSRIQFLIVEGYVKINEKIVTKKSQQINSGDQISITIPDNKEIEVVPEQIDLDIVYEDEHLLVVNKQKGMSVHPSITSSTGTLVNAVLGLKDIKLSGINGYLRPGIVHRIDKDTTGLIVVAKDDKTHKGLASQFFEHTTKREYIAIAHGIFSEQEGTIETGIQRSKKSRKKFEVVRKGLGKSAITKYKVLDVNDVDGNIVSLLRLHLTTGRTHQIRVHMTYLKHPLVGDHVYGSGRNNFNIKGQLLCARILGFVHPITNKEMLFKIKPPEDFYKFFPDLDGVID